MRLSHSISAVRKACLSSCLLLAFVAGAPRGLAAQTELISTDPEDNLLPYCPREFSFTVRSTVTNRIYAGYGFNNGNDDSFLGNVYYRVTNIPDATNTYVINGWFRLKGWKCRLASFAALRTAYPVLLWAEFEVVESPWSGIWIVCGPDNPSVTEVTYDPYTMEEPTTHDTSCAGGSTGSGTQFEPGESTGGETVGWSTGIGNGGSSACGAAAVVQYVCIDIWTPEAGWQEYSCGYATTC